MHCGNHIDCLYFSEDCWAEIDKVNQTYLKKEEPVEQLVRVVTVSSPSMREEEDQDLYVERDASQTKEVLVDWGTLDCIGMLLAVLGCSGLYWAAQGATELYSAVLVCSGL